MAVRLLQPLVDLVKPAHARTERILVLPQHQRAQVCIQSLALAPGGVALIIPGGEAFQEGSGKCDQVIVVYGRMMIYPQYIITLDLIGLYLYVYGLYMEHDMMVVVYM